VAAVRRLMAGQGTIVATGSISYPVGLERVGQAIGAEKVMTMTSTYDHRIIQGAESGRFLARIEAYLHGEAGFYERVFGDLGVELPPLPPPPVAAPAGPATAPAPAAAPPDDELLQAVQAATSLLKAHRTHGHRLWLRGGIEGGRFRTPLTQEEQKALLKRLTEVDALERFMHKAYLGQKQFSVEGLDMTVPMLDELIQLSAAQGAREVVLGMAHRGRLNVLAHNLGRPYDMIFAEFGGDCATEPITTIPQGGTGDVKYHHGPQGSYQLPTDEPTV